MSDVNESEIVVPKLEELMKNPEFQKQITSLLDSQVSKAVEAYKQKGFSSAVEKEVETRIKAKETKTPEQIRFEEYETKLAEMQNKIAEKEKLEMRMKNKDLAAVKFAELKLPASFIDFIVSEDETITTANMEKAIKALTEYQTEIKQSILGNNNTKVPGAAANVSAGELKEPSENASKEEWTAYWMAKRKK